MICRFMAGQHQGVSIRRYFIALTSAVDILWISTSAYLAGSFIYLTARQ
jgi:hypothetical protein